MEWQKLILAILEELDRVSEAKSCIMATAVLLDVLRAKGVKDAFPLTVKYKVFNPKFTDRLKTEPFPQTPEQMAQWQAEGCAMVAISGDRGATNQWPGHLVVVIPCGLKGRDAICDLSITQANVPTWDIILGSVLVGARDSFINSSEDFGVTVNGCQIIYRSFPEDQSFRQTPLWRRNLKRELIVKRVLKKLRN